MNGARNDRSLRAHSRIKVPKGPLHAVITKTAYRMDVFGDGRDGKRLYVCSFNVGLGKDDSTPVGRWVVGRGKQINPDWRNPITHEYHRADDPVNPIGEHWIPLHGTEERTRSMTGYGIHGTIEPESIGTQSSMGCVRLLPADVEQVYQLLAPEHSRVETRD